MRELTYPLIRCVRCAGITLSPKSLCTHCEVQDAATKATIAKTAKKGGDRLDIDLEDMGVGWVVGCTVVAIGILAAILVRTKKEKEKR